MLIFPVPALRRLFRQRHFLFLNLIGLSIGMAASFLLLLVVVHEASYDRALPDSERCYRVLGEDPAVGDVHAQLPYLLAPALQSEISGIELALRLAPAPLIQEVAEERIALAQCWAADGDAVSYFGLEALQGDLTDWSRTPRSILLSEAEARRLFGKADPVGRTLDVKMRDKTYTLQVAAVYADLPKTLSLRPESLCSIDMATAYWRDIFTWMPQSPGETWELPVYTTLLRLHSDSHFENIEGQMIEFAKAHGLAERFRLTLQPATDIYLHSAKYVNNRAIQGNHANLWIFSAIALFILAIATANHVLMGTAQAMKRVKEVSVRKVMGAARRQVAQLVLGESVLLAFMALPLAFLGVELGLPHVAGLLQVDLHESLLLSGSVLVAILGLTLIVGLLSGAYLAVFLARFEPIQILRRQRALSNRRSPLRRALLLFQITVFVLLIGLSLHVDRQMAFVAGHDPGFHPENRLSIALASPALRAQYASLKQEIGALPGVLSVGGASDLPPSESRATNRFTPKLNPDAAIDVECLEIDEGLVSGLGLTLLRGELPAPERIRTGTKVGLINETAVALFEGRDPLGERFFDTQIVGIVRDFHMHSLKTRIAPMLMTYDPSPLRHILIRYAPSEREALLSSLSVLWGPPLSGAGVARFRSGGVPGRPLRTRGAIPNLDPGLHPADDWRGGPWALRLFPVYGRTAHQGDGYPQGDGRIGLADCRAHGAGYGRYHGVGFGLGNASDAVGH